MTPRKADRNSEIVRRYEAGERSTDLAAEFGLHITRISQIVRQEKARAAAPPKAKPVDQPLPPELVAQLSKAGQREIATQQKARPRIRKAVSGLWECSDGVIARAARSFQGAYQKWLTAAIADAQRQVAPTSPVIPAPKPEPLPDYSGPITVLPGTAPRRALSLSTALQLNGARAAAAQPRMISIAGGSAREA